MPPIRLSVRAVTELVLRTGDIDSRYVDSSAMLDGAKAHRAIQKTMGKEYRPEVSVHIDTEADGIPVTLQGRADGVIEGEDALTVDEIKTTTLPLDRLYEQRELHLGQAKCYAHMLLESAGQPPANVTIQLTYYQLDTGELRRHRFDYSREEIAAFFRDLLQKYSVWLRFETEWQSLRTKSVRSANFPFPSYRKGQRELAVAAYRTIERKKKLYVQAPTGVGKTMSTLFPAIKAVGEGKAGKLFYLTAKTVTRAVAEENLSRLCGQGLRFKSVTLRAKDKICFQEETVCNPDACPYAKGHYDRVNGAVLELLRAHDVITPAVIEDMSRRHRVCPHETTLDAALFADLVICDYNHVFDPRVYLRRFFSDDGADRGYVFLIDEAHNLGDRVRDMYTAALSKSKFLALKRALKDKNAEAAALRGSMEKINRHLLERRKAIAPHTEQVTEEADTELEGLVLHFVAAAENWFGVNKGNAHPLHEELLALYFEAVAFAGIAGMYDERYASILEAENSEVTATLFCLDPSRVIAKKLGFAGAGVLFSATLTPLPYYREMLGGGEEDYILSLPSPFARKHLTLIAHGGISTKYTDRAGSLLPLSEAIAVTAASRKGNYMVFFPSYAYMKQGYDAFAEAHPEVETILQHGGMGEEERVRFLARFDAENPGTLVGFCVLGGVFSEGIDLVGDRLIGAVIVGVGLPGISLRQDLIRDYFNRVNGAGYDYAYVFPGMNKVLQAAGRVIRSEEDRGTVLLIDSRFATAKYRALYPAHWDGMRFVFRTEEIADSLQNIQTIP